MTQPPPPPPPPSDYPVSLTFDPPARIARWRPLLHWLLAIPHFVVLYAIGIVAFVLVVLAWFAGVFTGRVPGDLQKPMVMYLRYNARVTTYALFQREEYPPFSFDGAFADPGDDPRLRVDVVPAIEDRSRATIFFRMLMILPQVFVLMFVSIAAAVIMVVGWFAVILLGRWPAGMNRFLIGFLRWNTRVNAYGYLLADAYPPFSTR